MVKMFVLLGAEDNMKEHFYRLALGALIIAAGTIVCFAVVGLFWLASFCPIPAAIITTVFLAWVLGTLIRWRDERR